jgi:hypothetical protein
MPCEPDIIEPPEPAVVGSMSGTSRCINAVFSFCPVNSTVTFLGLTLTLAAPDTFDTVEDVIIISDVAIEVGTPKTLSILRVIISPSSMAVVPVPVLITIFAVAPTSGGVIVTEDVPPADIVCAAAGAANGLPPVLTPSNSGAISLATTFWPENIPMLTIKANTPITTAVIIGKDSLKPIFFAI